MRTALTQTIALQVVMAILKLKPFLLHIAGAGRNTLVHMCAASVEDRQELLIFLLEQGGDGWVKNVDGDTALDLAERVEDE